MRVEQLLKQLRREFIKVNLLQSLLDGLVFFLVSNIVLFFFNINVFSSVPNSYVLAAATLAFSLSDLYYRTQQYDLELYEEKNPELQEILRTARDNIDKNNIVSQALFDDLLDRARRVTSESIIPAKQIIYKTLAVGILSFLTVMSGLADFQLGNQGTDLLQSPEDLQRFINDGDDDGFELENSSDVFGDESDIDASDMRINFSVEGSGSAENADLGSEDGGAETVTLDSTASFDEELALARRYSLAIKELG
ncbi:DUF7502 family protein [Candidatus Nanohalococcus occultus]|uniref:Membrane protein n=1 Tax=Candidatus Nanohalococcus occultus TaxID=2978047 RepID=A0ABY8CJN5_9ARCH|nr:putative membrane protein [Candidatus Nanohaloarchaeota archaeon SVXNc]